jgi:dTDP-4-dehydrorhamnose 3,5-epimerase
LPEEQKTMEFTETPFKGLFICKPKIISDSRGYFCEVFNVREFQEQTGFPANFVQDNQSMSKYGVIRGLHMQGGRSAQAKLVRCVQGSVLDVVVDMRKEEPTFGMYFSAELSEENHLQLYIPHGFAHGFSVLKGEAVFSYKCDSYYDREREIGIAYNDPQLNIDWQLPEVDRIISDKDRQNLSFAEAAAKLQKMD